MASDTETRRRWIAPPAEGDFDGLELAWLDPADQDDRHVLILSEHPELSDAIRRDPDEVDVGGSA